MPPERGEYPANSAAMRDDYDFSKSTSNPYAKARTKPVTIRHLITSEMEVAITASRESAVEHTVWSGE